MMNKRYFRLLSWFLLLWISPSCFGQVIRVRIINGENGHALPKQQVSVTLFYEKGEQKPAKYDAVLNLETDVNGEAQFKLPVPPPVHFSATVSVDWSRWKCACGILGSTDDLIQKGIMWPEPTNKSKNSDALFTAAPGEVLFVFHPLTFFERLFYPLYKD
jgi:hypothetical protein